MNILNRIKKIEVEKTAQSFCACQNTQKHEVIYRRDGIDTLTTSVAESCDDCGKPVEKTTIIVNFVKAKKPDWMADSQRADERHLAIFLLIQSKVTFKVRFCKRAFAENKKSRITTYFSIIWNQIPIKIIH